MQQFAHFEQEDNKTLKIGNSKSYSTYLVLTEKLKIPQKNQFFENFTFLQIDRLSILKQIAHFEPEYIKVLKIGDSKCYSADLLLTEKPKISPKNQFFEIFIISPNGQLSFFDRQTTRQRDRYTDRQKNSQIMQKLFFNVMFIMFKFFPIAYQ